MNIPTIYQDMFSTPEMRQVWSEKNLVQCWLDVECALAKAEAQAGIIPEQVVPAIEAACRLEKIDLKELKRGAELVGYPILPLVRQIAALAGGDAGGYVHWGATTQDIMDTASVLQLRQSLFLIETSLGIILSRLEDMARNHRMTVMAGRTHGQQALPVTLGYKLAVFIVELRRHRRRLECLKPRLFLVEFAGAVGTFASLGRDGLLVQENLARLLELDVPPISWHTSRDGFTELVSTLGFVGTTLGKLAQEIAFMQRTEIGEVEEGYLDGRGSSSTMPQKRNPITCEVVIGASRKLIQLVPAAMEFMLHDGERATGPWHTEWLVIPEACLLAEGMLVQTSNLLKDLVVHPEQMRLNLEMTHGLINAEAVMMALAPHLGRQTAHDLVYAASMRAVVNRTSLAMELEHQPEITAELSGSEIKQLLKPENYTGLSAELVDRVLSQ